jgi:uncharacterized protein YcfJ
MKRLAITTLAVALSAAAGGAAAYHQDGYGTYDSRYDNAAYSPRVDYARVIRVERLGYGNQYGTLYGSNVRQECWNETTNAYEGGYYRDQYGRLYRGDGRSSSGGALLGALIGGALGNQVGKGDGRTAATIGGAVIGGAIGAHVDNDRYDEYRDTAGVVRRCRMVSYDNAYDNRSYRGYNVTYVYGGNTYHAITRYNPGRTIRVVVDVRPQDTGVAYDSDY